MLVNTNCTLGMTNFFFASLHYAQPAPTATRALNILTHQLALASTGLLDLCSCATPVLPELGGKAGENPPRIGRRRPRPDPRAPPSEISLLLPSHLASYRRLPYPSGGWGERKSIVANGVWLALRPPPQIFSCPMSVSV
jgi:hypothetical protein